MDEKQEPGIGKEVSIAILFEWLSLAPLNLRFDCVEFSISRVSGNLLTINELM